jgi:hypothetical protein
LAENSYQVAPAGRRPRIGRLDLVLAVACLGALAAVAVPRQQALTERSHRTEVQALADGVHSAAAFGHSLWIARGMPETIDLRGRVVRMVNGYPAAGDVASLMERAESMGFQQSGGRWRHEDERDGLACGVSYAPPAEPAGLPVVSQHTKGC